MSGKVGVTDFSKAKQLAEDFMSIIRVANNIEGAKAISEEFAHLIVGVFRDSNLVKRAINYLASNNESLQEVLGEEYDFVYNFYNGNLELVAEETVGKLLRKNFLKEINLDKTKSPSLFRRVIDFIKNQFKRFSTQSVQEELNNIDNSLSYLANKILTGEKLIKKSDVEKINREEKFNALSSKVSRNMSILKDAIKVELKKAKIITNSDSSEFRIRQMKSRLLTQEETVKGIMEYAKYALESLSRSAKSLDDMRVSPSDGDFKILRGIKANIESFNGFIYKMREALQEDRRTTESDRDSTNLFWNKITIDGQDIDVKEVIDQLSILASEIENDFFELSSSKFSEFLKPFLGDKIVVPFGKDKGKVITVESLLEKATKDISFMDKWLDSMADSSDLLLQLFDGAVKQAKDKIRLNTLKYYKESEELRLYAESLGITDFGWMFDTDEEGNKTGYMISRIDWVKYNKHYLDFMKSLDERYGENPTGETLKDKQKEIYQWHKENSVNTEKGIVPRPSKYTSTKYKSLSKNQRDVLDKWLAIKHDLDDKYGKPNLASKAIQIRKNVVDRIASSKNAQKAYENIKEAVQDSLLDRVDDEELYGTSTGLRGFSGKEFMTLPVLYTKMLENSNDISEDVFSALNAYAYAANTYVGLGDIIDPLEIGRTLVIEKRKVEQTRGNKSVVERIKLFGTEIKDTVIKDSSTNIEAKLNDFFESQVYLRHFKDEGTFEIFGKAINVNKATSQLLKYSSLAQLGFNWLSNIANAANGVAMINIEVAASQFFDKSTLFKADKIYASEIPSMVAELGKRNKTNKLDLFNELFNVKQDFETRIKDSKLNNALKRIFGESVAYFGQSAGDHWLYNRVAIAMALNTQVKIPGNKESISLWEALRIDDFTEGSNVKQLVLPEGTTDLDGNSFDIGKFGRKIANVNQHLFGIYNSEDSNAANRVAVGRLLMQYRKWMKPSYNKRFMGAQYNATLGIYEEGYYRTLFRFANELMRGKFQIAASWEDLTDYEKSNIYRCLMEFAQLIAVYTIAGLLGDDDEDAEDKTFAYKLTEYTFVRLKHELGALAPTPGMTKELLKTVRSPLASATTINNLLNLTTSLVTPSHWTDELRSGPYKGMSTLEKNFLKAPLPGVAQYRNIDKFVGELDTSINYYARPW